LVESLGCVSETGFLRLAAGCVSPGAYASSC